MSSRNYILQLLDTKNYEELNKLSKTEIDIFLQEVFCRTSLLIYACAYNDLNNINIILSKLEYSDIKYIDETGDTALRRAFLNTYTHSEDIINILLFYYDRNNKDDFEYLNLIKNMSIIPKTNKLLIEEYLNDIDYVLK